MKLIDSRLAFLFMLRPNDVAGSEASVAMQNFLGSCRDVNANSSRCGVLTAECRNLRSEWRPSVLYVSNCLTHEDGELVNVPKSVSLLMCSYCHFHTDSWTAETYAGINSSCARLVSFLPPPPSSPFLSASVSTCGTFSTGTTDDD